MFSWIGTKYWYVILNCFNGVVIYKNDKVLICSELNLTNCFGKLKCVLYKNKTSNAILILVIFIHVLVIINIYKK